MTSTQSEPPERGGQVGSADAGLVELEKQRNEVLRRTEHSDEKAGEAALQEPYSDEDTAKQLSALEALERQIATGPAQGLEGVAVKLRVATSLLEEGKAPDEPALAEWDCIKTATETVERLAGRPATVATVDATSGRILSIPVLHNTPAGHSTLVVEDSCFAPLILEGDTVVIAPGQSRLDSGAFYAIKREGKTQIWLADEGGASLPGDYKTEVWLLTLNEPFRWAGPCDRQEVKTIGRVVGVLDKDRSLAPKGDPVVVHDAEWQWLHRRSIELALKQWRLEKDLPERVRENTLFELSPCERKARHAEREAEAEKIGLADIERRSAAISARLGMVAGMIEGVPATTVAGALAKLQILWHYEYESPPDDERASLERHPLKGAIEALGGEALIMRWTEEEVRARYGHLAGVRHDCPAQGPQAGSGSGRSSPRTVLQQSCSTFAAL